MAKAKKLPSGSWRVLAFSHWEETKQSDGTIKKKRVYVSFTSDDPSPRGKKEAERLAAEWALTKNTHSAPTAKTFREALEDYIQERSKVSKPPTMRKYKSMQRNRFHALNGYKLRDLNQNIVQKWVNECAASLSPKSVQDTYGLFTAVLNRFIPGTTMKVTLPSKEHVERYTPTEEEIHILINAARGTDMEIPIYLAAFGTLRRGEVSALLYEDIEGDRIHVHRNMVDTDAHTWVIKTPKTYTSDRYVTMPHEVIQIIGTGTGRITQLRPNMITSRFEHLLKQAGLPHFRFHDLRHFAASYMHANGVPNAYIMQMGGWSNERILNEIYRHPLKDRKTTIENAIAEQFSKIMQHEMQHGQQKKP